MFSFALKFLFSFQFCSICCLFAWSPFLTSSLFKFPSFRVTPRCFAALGDVSTVRFLHQTNQIADKVFQDTVSIRSQTSSLHSALAGLYTSHFIPHKKWSGTSTFAIILN